MKGHRFEQLLFLWILWNVSQQLVPFIPVISGHDRRNTYGLYPDLLVLKGAESQLGGACQVRAPVIGPMARTGPVRKALIGPIHPGR